MGHEITPASHGAERKCPITDVGCDLVVKSSREAGAPAHDRIPGILKPRRNDRRVTLTTFFRLAKSPRSTTSVSGPQLIHRPTLCKYGRLLDHFERDVTHEMGSRVSPVAD